jgi:hypothetical protein
MRDLIVLVVHLITTVLRIARPGGLRSVVAESVLIRHQLLIVSRSRRRAPNLYVLDRLIAGFCSLWIKPKRLLRSAIAFKPSTLLNFHRALVQRKYRLLFFAKEPNEAWAKRSTPGFNSCGCRHEAPQPEVGMSSYCRTDRVSFRNIY